MIGIYKIENTVNGKVYFGQTVDYEKRKSSHIRALNGGYHRNRYLQSSWNKYGEDSFVFSFIKECNEQQLNDLEIGYIKDNNSLIPNGYNLTVGGEGCRGAVWSEASRKRLSEARKGVPINRTAETSADTRAKMSEAQKTLWSDPAHREKMRNAHIGQFCSQETRKKMSEARKGIVRSDAHKVLCVETGVVYPAVSKIDIGRKIERSTIYRSCKTGLRAYGYHWLLL